MKQNDRSLEIVAVGLGQAGGNLAAEFGRRGYGALALNTARTDLHSLGAGRHGLPDDQRIYIGLEGYDGAGSDLEYGRECIRQHADRIREAVKETATDADVVVVTAGLGGGTGSNLSELVKLLEELELPLVALTTLPHSHESGIAKVNALTGVRDLADTPLHGWVLIDNSRLSRRHHDAPIDSYFDTINEAILEPLDAFNRLNDRDSIHAIRTLDGEDFRTLLLTGGVLNLHTEPLSSLRTEAVVQAVRGALTESPMMPAGFELRNVAYLGLVIEASERALHECPFSFYEEIAEQLKQETGGAAMYLGLYRRPEGEGPAATLRLLASSNALPASIGPMLSQAEREAGAIRDKVQRRVHGFDLGGLDDLHLTRRPGRADGGSEAAAPVARPSRHAMPEPAPSPSPEPAAASPAPEPAPSAEPREPEQERPSRRPSGPLTRAFELAGHRISRERGPLAKAGSGAAPPPPAPEAEEHSEVAALRRLVAMGGPAESAELPPAPETVPAPEAAAPDAPEKAPAPEAAAPPAPEKAPAPKAAAPPAPAPASDVAPPPAPRPRVQAPRTGSPDYRARFERMAQAYREAPESDTKRIYIGRELVAALRSEQALERLHAVAAMARIDPVYFEEALRTAADDADSHVADVARRGLKGSG